MQRFRAFACIHPSEHDSTRVLGSIPHFATLEKHMPEAMDIFQFFFLAELWPYSFVIAQLSPEVGRKICLRPQIEVHAQGGGAQLQH